MVKYFGIITFTNQVENLSLSVTELLALKAMEGKRLALCQPKRASAEAQLEEAQAREPR
jgi:hypothetical protein